MGTLSDALETGQGIERPFQCEVHEDTSASASVNVAKGVWYCHACHASGTVEGKKAPSAESLAVLMRPEKIGRTYPTSWLALFEPADLGMSYWHTRFPDWLTHAMSLGQDPFTGDATFPVHTGEGRLAGVGKRAMATKEELKELDQPRYRYPHTWSAASSFFGTMGRYWAEDVVVLVEGAADATAVAETGALGLACYGAGLHFPQRELLARFAPRLVLLGFDMDEAGENAVTRAFSQISRLAPLKRVRWSGNDPADVPRGQRLDDLLHAVTLAGYGGNVLPRWNHRLDGFRNAYETYLEDSA